MRRSWVQFWLLRVHLFFNCTQYMQLPTNHIALPVSLSSTLGSPGVPTEAHLPILLHILLSCIVEARSVSWLKQYSSVLKGYTASKTSRLYLFQPKHIFLPYLSVAMHFIHYQHGMILFAGYYIVACYT